MVQYVNNNAKGHSMMQRDELRKRISEILMDDTYSTISLAKAIGIGYRSFMRFLRDRGASRSMTEIKINRFIARYNAKVNE